MKNEITTALGTGLCALRFKKLDDTEVFVRATMRKDMIPVEFHNGDYSRMAVENFRHAHISGDSLRHAFDVDQKKWFPFHADRIISASIISQ